MSLLAGIFFGILVSLPPGPSSFAVMKAAIDRQVGRAFKNVGGFIAADVLVLFICGIVCMYFGMESNNAYLKGLASAFLIFYGIRMYFKKSAEGAPTKNFFLTLLNPGIWLANFAVLALAGTTTKSDFVAYAIGIQLGALAWYSILIFILPRIGKIGPIFLTRIAPAALVATGLWIAVR